MKQEFSLSVIVSARSAPKFVRLFFKTKINCLQSTLLKLLLAIAFIVLKRYNNTKTNFNVHFQKVPSEFPGRTRRRYLCIAIHVLGKLVRFQIVRCLSLSF